ncbi:nuclear transport factor 2 family protein [Gramella sp. AN32]|uniref:Nuclear transport factor 2 family protein n=1 Tax=Christiangramia antarctica TaxID=2058158 RepID=A0ABW5X2W4_9FLAO|nr:nuclear transport factor 2 family protein [Gramella sp. AN32]MCM4155191.1 hypothetical protein [Gramella sp. AN32]
MKKFLFIFSLIGCFFFTLNAEAQVKETEKLIAASKNQITKNLNGWHKAAADADFKKYFGYMTKDAVFIGTDATENWDLKSFKKFSKPYFDEGKAWSFTPLERNIYVSLNRGIAWFDELLSTQMGICRGSGVMKMDGDSWKIQHYVLSIAIPNENVDEITKMKKEFDENLISALQKSEQ